MISANEIALQSKIKVLEAELKELKLFEREVSMSFTKCLLGIMSKDEPITTKAFEELKDLIKDRAIRNMKKEGGIL